jgi:putative nucleotidyltransferase with HDIG domain
MSGFLGLFQYFFVRDLLEDHFRQNRELIRDRVLNIVRDADYMNLQMEKPLEQEAKSVLDAVMRKYEAAGNIQFDLEPFLEGTNGFLDLYIISRENIVVASTDPADLGLNFAPYSDFAGYLDEIRETNQFAPARISLSLKGSEMKKYCYLPSEDGKYIFETGTKMKPNDLPAEGIGFENFAESVIRDSGFVDSVILYDYEGVSYKQDQYGRNSQIDDSHLAYFQEAMDSMQTVEVMSGVNGSRAFRQYVPYQIMEARGANEKNVVEIIYNDASMRQSLAYNMKIAIAVVLLGAVLAGSFGLYKASSITKPIEEFTAGFEQVASGNFLIHMKIESNDEFALLGKQFESMAERIRLLLAERYENEGMLANKNVEIMAQKEQITSLYDELASLLKENQNSYFETVRALANAIEAKDAYTGGHCERVMEYSMGIAHKLGLSEEERNDLRFGSILHDIGKIGIPEQVLNNQGSFLPEDYELMKRHPEIGDNILKELNFLANSRKIVYEHHERVDGRGYPNGLKGDQINKLSKIVCAADAYDAMTSLRPYRKDVLSKEAAVRELLLNRGTQFDEEVVDAFISWLEEKPE